MMAIRYEVLIHPAEPEVNIIIATRYEAPINPVPSEPEVMIMLPRIPELEIFVIPDVEFTGKRLGEGVFGQVEEVQIPQSVCEQKGLEWFPSFAAKMLKYQAEEYTLTQQRLISECFLMNEVRHPNLALFLGISYETGEAHLPALIMERLETSLHDKLLEKAEFPLEQRIAILLDVSNGLSYIHSKSLCHRDLTAKNILLSSDGVAKIADFGIAKIIEIPSLLSIYLSKNPGNLYYMPPEASESPAKYSTPIDIFSFGVVALFTGTREFPTPLPSTYLNGRSQLTPRNEIERRQNFLDKLSHYIGKRHPLNALVKQCLNYHPKKRPSAKNLHVTLQAILPRRSEERFPPVPTVPRSSQNNNVKLKVILLGDSNVGKTALLNRYERNEFRNMPATLNPEVIKSIAQIDGKPVTVNIWDTTGFERFRSVVPAYCRKVHACLLVYDVNRPETLDTIERIWRPMLRQISPDAECILVGNRIDEHSGGIDSREAERFAEQFNMDFIKTSAKTAENVDDMFERAIAGAYRKAPKVISVDLDRRTLDGAANNTTERRRCSC